MPLTTNHVNNSTEILFNQLKTLLQNNKFNCTTMCFDDTQNNVNKILNKHPDANLIFISNTEEDYDYVFHNIPKSNPLIIDPFSMDNIKLTNKECKKINTLLTQKLLHEIQSSSQEDLFLQINQYTPICKNTLLSLAKSHKESTNIYRIMRKIINSLYVSATLSKNKHIYYYHKGELCH